MLYVFHVVMYLNLMNLDTFVVKFPNCATVCGSSNATAKSFNFHQGSNESMLLR